MAPWDIDGAEKHRTAEHALPPLSAQPRYIYPSSHLGLRILALYWCSPTFRSNALPFARALSPSPCERVAVGPRVVLPMARALQARPRAVSTLLQYDGDGCSVARLPACPACLGDPSGTHGFTSMPVSIKGKPIHGWSVACA